MSRSTLKRLSTALPSLALLFFSCFVQAGDVKPGKALFGTYCQTCHGPNGDGNGRDHGRT